MGTFVLGGLLQRGMREKPPASSSSRNLVSIYYYFKLGYSTILSAYGWIRGAPKRAEVIEEVEVA